MCNGRRARSMFSPFMVGRRKGFLVVMSRHGRRKLSLLRSSGNAS